MNRPHVLALPERFKRGCDLAPREIVLLFAYISRLEGSGVTCDWHAHLGWIPGSAGRAQAPPVMRSEA